MLKVLLLATVAVGSLAVASGAQAVPTLQYTILDGTTTIGSSSSTTGILSLVGVSGNFSVSGMAASAPFLPAPNFSTNTFTISSGASATGGTLTIRVSATDLTGYSGGSVMNTFTLNSLNGGPFTSGTLSTYFDNSNAAYGQGTLLATTSFSGSDSFRDSNDAFTAPSGLFSETTIYTLTYGAGGVGTVSASSQLTAVPEPASLALLGAGLIGAGMIRRRRDA